MDVSGPDERWLLHTWSLAVEWQFYLLYPILLALVSGLHGWLAGRSGRERVLGLTVRQATVLAMCAVWAVSLALCVRRTGLDQVGAFFSLSPRVWEMVSGGLVYMAEPLLAGWALRFGRGWRWLAFALFALAMSGGLEWGWEQRWPGVLALVPVLGAMLLLAAGAGGQPSPAWMNGRWVQRLGRWSYSIYLWHWPVHVLNNFLEWPAEWAPWVALWGVLLSLGLGAASYRFVECQFKYRQAESWWHRGEILPVAGAAVLLVCATLVVTSQGWKGRTGADIAFYESRIALIKPLDYPAFCHNFKRPKEAFRMCSLNRTVGGPRVLLIGDSHAEHLFPWFAQNARRRVDIFTGGGCPTAQGFNRMERGYHCNDLSKAAYQLASDPRYDTVIVAANLGGFDRNPSNMCRVDQGSCIPGAKPAIRDELARANVVAWRRLLSQGKRLVIVNQVPIAPYNLPREAIRRRFIGLPEAQTYSEKRPPGAGARRYLDDVLSLVGDEPGLELVDLRPQVCDGAVCRTNDARTGLPIFFDNSHFTADWIRAHGGVFAKYVQVDQAAH